MAWDGTVVTETSGRRIQCRALDLSDGGARLRSTWHPYPGKRIAVKFQLDGKPVQMQGVVVWSTQADGMKECGVQFTVGHPSCRQRLHEFVVGRLADALPAAGPADPLAPLWSSEADPETGDLLGGLGSDPSPHAGTPWEGLPRVGEPVGWPTEPPPPPARLPYHGRPDDGPVPPPSGLPYHLLAPPSPSLEPDRVSAFEPPPLDEPLEVLDEALVSDPPTLDPSDVVLQDSSLRVPAGPVDDGPTRLRPNPLRDGDLTRQTSPPSGEWDRFSPPASPDDGQRTSIFALDEAASPAAGAREAASSPAPEPDASQPPSLDEETTRKHKKSERPAVTPSRRRRGWLSRLTGDQ